MKLSFPKNKRLVSNEQFKAVLAAGRPVRDNLLVLYTAENDCGYSRLGVSVGKSYGNAVKRNRFKRLMREVFRQNQDKIPSNLDYLVMVSRKTPKNFKPAVYQSNTRPDFKQLEKSFLTLVGKAVKD